MKKIIIMLFLAIVLFGCNVSISETKEMHADIISLNQNIIRGKMIGSLLSSPDASFRNDVNIVGVRLKLRNQTYLFDIQMKHAEIAQYANSTKIPLIVKYSYDKEKQEVIYVKFNHRIIWLYM